MKMKLVFFSMVAFAMLALFRGWDHGWTSSSARADVDTPPLATMVISNPGDYSRIVAISDVHGMFDNAVTLLRAGGVMDTKNNWTGGRSLLVVTGDSIDKGPNSLEVLDLWIRLRAQARSSGGDVIHVLGNHEAEFLADPTNDSKAKDLIAEMKEQGVPLSDLTGTESLRGQFLHEEPLALKIGGWLFCHSGLFPAMSWEDFSSQAQQALSSQNYNTDLLIGDNSILEAKKWELSSTTVNTLLQRLVNIGLYGVVFGHQPEAFGIEGRTAAKYGGRLIKIDNGMAPEAGSHVGSLLVFANPQGMTAASFAAVQASVITPDGVTHPLTPE